MNNFISEFYDQHLMIITMVVMIARRTWIVVKVISKGAHRVNLTHRKRYRQLTTLRRNLATLEQGIDITSFRRSEDEH